MIKITARYAIESGIWEKLCRLKDIDYWVSLDHEVELTDEEARELGIGLTEAG